MENKVCPICEDGVLALKEGVNETVHKGVKGSVRFFYEECDACGSEQVDARLSADNCLPQAGGGLLTGKEARAVRECLRMPKVILPINQFPANRDQ